MSTKLDDRVIFPLDGLDLSDYVAGETNTNQQYNLYACVCHMGGEYPNHVQYILMLVNLTFLIGIAMVEECPFAPVHTPHYYIF